MKLDRTVIDNNIYPERILQYGEGNFLRAFVDWMVDKMNRSNNFNSGVVAVQPIAEGLADLINRQNGLYHVVLQGIKNQKPIKKSYLIDCITRAINPYQNFDAYIKIAENPHLRFIISNTTEAGITYHKEDRMEQKPQSSFPAKVTAFLYKRFKTFDGDKSKGVALICCELIDRNADKLKQCVLKHVEEWNIEKEFISWLDDACAFCNTLVDRIVPGFPKDNIKEIQKELGFEDQLVVVGEYFHLWVIEAPDWVQKEFPTDKCDLNIKFVKDITPYRERKVRVLNGAHTGSFAVSILANINTVKESVEHPIIGDFMKDMVFDEILPTLQGTQQELTDFANQILERFYNPFVQHLWTSIALNSMSKWKTRNMFSLLDYYTKNKKLPPKLTFSLSALIAYYKGEFRGKKITLQDDELAIKYMADCWAMYNGTKESLHKVTQKALAFKQNWGQDLNDIPDLTTTVTRYLSQIFSKESNGGIEEILKKLK